MKLLTQPGDGVNPILSAINSSKESVDIAIFRFDRKELERALINAVNRGVQVRALIACTNRGGEKRLRELEARLLQAGVTVARTNDDLVRYHAKYLIIDRTELFLLAFNFTYLDIEQSRSFGVIIRNKKAVEEAAKVFEMDMKRQPYQASLDWLVVSPANARSVLTKFIEGARKNLHIYDPSISDPAMTRLLEKRAKDGVSIKVLGRMIHHSPGLEVSKLHPMRLHTRMILRDGAAAFLGSQSLRTVELDRRREVGIIFEDAEITASMMKTFESDWAATELAKHQKGEPTPIGKVAKKVAKAMMKDMPPIAPMVEAAIQEVGNGVQTALDSEELEETVKDAVKHAIKSAVKEAIEAPTS